METEENNGSCCCHRHFSRQLPRPRALCAVSFQPHRASARRGLCSCHRRGPRPREPGGAHPAGTRAELRSRLHPQRARVREAASIPNARARSHLHPPPTRVREAASAPTRARGAASIPTRVRATLVRRSGRALPACGVRAAWAGAASVGAAAGKTPRAKAGGPTGRAGPGSGGEARVRVVPLPWALEARGAGALAIRRPTRSKTSRDRGEDVGQASGERDSSVHSPGAGVRISKRLRTWPWRQR